MFRKLALAAIFTVAAMPAFAAGGANGNTASANPVAFDWGGGYVGLNAGGTWQNTTASYTEAFAMTNIFGQGEVPSGNNHLTGGGFMGGLTAGYNIQSGSIVWGVEGDFMGAAVSNKNSQTWTPTIGADPHNATDTKTETDWLSTLRARVGTPVLPNTLLYGTGGLAIGQVSSSTSFSPTGNGNTCSNNFLCSTGSASETKVGWTLGGGAEYALASKWTMKLDYLYYDLGSFNYNVNAVSPAFPANVGEKMASAKVGLNGNLIRVGVNYKF